MTVKLTERMQAWIEKMGCHLCVATPQGVPYVALGRYARVTGEDEVAFALAKDELSVIYPALSVNPWVAFGVSHQGGIRASFQFKGIGHLVKEGPLFDNIAKDAEAVDTYAVLYVKISEIYCTKPGAEAGQRLDIMSPDEVCDWEKVRWKDIPRK
ncbi:hypothetical protein [Methanoplanus endosymbiosus]|uniref:Pyridoxamine 5'-phosphate oxidase family protein n=1 Tax=Methanoplanus endosymbiosus TaxID=33865 RepID=A0A9E7PME3_9EURY|nr:hypothetical protein [Methanoplanus endosymbiosus]UUX92885.1 hypothetical protein L6E24_01785 [Methanoplanus endosymbiosus]